MTREEFASLALGCLEELTAFARRLARDRADADDLVQGSFERAFRSWRSLREPGACRAWLFRITRNLYLDHVVSNGPQLRLVEEAKASLPEIAIPAEAVERLAAHDLEAALQRLPPEQREAVLLCDLWGFEYAQISSITGSPIGTVRSRIARGRTKLASLLAAWRTGAQGRRQ